MKSKQKKVTIFSLLGIAVILLILWFTGLIGLWTNGMSHIAYNSPEKGHALPGEYSISIDLSDLQSNVGKELYKDDTHSIYVTGVDNPGNVESGGYRIGFRSIGQYSLKDASLVSGVHHITKDNSYTHTMSAEMKAEYNGKTYESTISAIGGINYKDGDDFDFYIFPTEAYENNDISLDEKGIVTLTVSNLHKNVWNKKSET